MDTVGANDELIDIEQQTKELCRSMIASQYKRVQGRTAKIVRYLLIFFSLYAVFLLFYPGETREASQLCRLHCLYGLCRSLPKWACRAK